MPVIISYVFFGIFYCENPKLQCRNTYPQYISKGHKPFKWIPRTSIISSSLYLGTFWYENYPEFKNQFNFAQKSSAF